MKFDQQNECVLQSGFPVSPVLFSEFPFTVSPFFFSFSPEHVFSFSASGFCVCPSSKALPTFFLSLEPQPFPLKCFFFSFSDFRISCSMVGYSRDPSQVCVFLWLWATFTFTSFKTVVPLVHMTLGAQVPFPWG